MMDYLIKRGFVRNPNHAIWFVSSVFLCYFAILIFVGKAGRWAILVPIIFHISAIISSIYTLYIKKETSEVYSKDCIWWNSLMIVVYLILMYKL